MRAAIWLLACAQLVCAFSSGDAWIRKYPCGGFRPDFPSLETTSFWLDSFRGSWNDTHLHLGVLAVYNETLFSCADADFPALKSLEFTILGHPVGEITNFATACPGRLFHGHLRAATIDLVYELSPRRLQTAVAQMRVVHTNGSELDCGVAKITPDMGRAGAAFTFTPLGILALVGVSSFQAHVFAESRLWATVLDVGQYLRQLQFVFVSAAMRLWYPGFYVPVASKLAWANLLYWRGPLDRGYSHVGVDGGMYVTNFSNGYQFMKQTMGYPNMLNTLANSLIHMVMMAAPVFFVLAVLFLKTTGAPMREGLTQAAGITVGLALCFFSVPLLSYMAYDLVLVGYLPNYRIALAIAMVLVMIGANYFLVGRIDGQIKLPVQNTESELRRAWRKVSRYIPHSMPLAQAIAVGGLQDFPLAQVITMAGCELVFLLYALQNFRGPKVYCSVLRLLAIGLSGPFVEMELNEVIRQRLGYAVLALHCVAIFSFVFEATWRLYRTLRARRSLNDEHEAVAMHHLPSRSSSAPSEYRMTPSPEQPRTQNRHNFYRQPRTSTFDHLARESNSESTETDSMESVELQREPPFNLTSVLEQLPTKGRVDYSFREADLFYGIPEDSSSTPTDEESLDYEPGGSGRSRWSWRVAKKPKKEEKGFSVVRPPRPPV